MWPVAALTNRWFLEYQMIDLLQRLYIFSAKAASHHHFGKQDRDCRRMAKFDGDRHRGARTQRAQRKTPDRTLCVFCRLKRFVIGIGGWDYLTGVQSTVSIVLMAMTGSSKALLICSSTIYEICRKA